MNLNILGELLNVLERIEKSQLDQHNAAFQVGKLLKEMYIDSALLKADKIDKKTGKKIEGSGERPVPAKNISWKEFKIREITPL